MYRYQKPPEVGAEAQRQRDLRALKAIEIAEDKAQEQRDAERKARDAERAKRVSEWEAEDARIEAERATQREADRVARVESSERDLKERLRASYLETPGASPEGFARIWPRLLEEHQVAETIRHGGETLAQRTAREMKEWWRSPHLPERPLPTPIED